jgi:hypothetical protein
MTGLRDWVGVALMRLGLRRVSEETFKRLIELLRHAKQGS